MSGTEEESEEGDLELDQEYLDSLPWEDLQSLARDLDIPVGDLRQPKNGKERGKIPLDLEKLREFMTQQAHESTIGRDWIPYIKKEKQINNNNQIQQEEEGEDSDLEALDSFDLALEGVEVDKEALSGLIEELDLGDSLLGKDGKGMIYDPEEIIKGDDPTKNVKDDGINNFDVSIFDDLEEEEEENDKKNGDLIIKEELNLNNHEEIYSKSNVYFKLICDWFLNQQKKNMKLSSSSSSRLVDFNLLTSLKFCNCNINDLILLDQIIPKLILPCSSSSSSSFLVPNLTVLGLDTNNLSGKGIVALMRAIAGREAAQDAALDQEKGERRSGGGVKRLGSVHVTHQRSAMGTRAEEELCEVFSHHDDDATSPSSASSLCVRHVVRLGVSLRSAIVRDCITRAVQGNLDYARREARRRG
eukprot:Nk52_evm1s2329 gene=Nk52_evmTU1s2329